MDGETILTALVALVAGGGIWGTVTAVLNNRSAEQQLTADREAETDRSDASMALQGFISLTERQNTEIAANRAEITVLRKELADLELRNSKELADERSRCDRELADRDNRIERLSTSLTHLYEEFRQFRTNHTTIALEEAGRLSVAGFLREVGKVADEEAAWDGTSERRHPHSPRRETPQSD